jgi:hypothetical protein
MESPAASAEPKPGVDGPTPHPDPKNEAAWPGKGPIRSFGFMVGERQAFWNNRQMDQGAVVFVGDSLIGGWARTGTTGSSRTEVRGVRVWFMVRLSA